MQPSPPADGGLGILLGPLAGGAVHPERQALAVERSRGRFDLLRPALWLAFSQPDVVDALPTPERFAEYTI